MDLVDLDAVIEGWRRSRADRAVGLKREREGRQKGVAAAAAAPAAAARKRIRLTAARGARGRA